MHVEPKGVNNINLDMLFWAEKLQRMLFKPSNLKFPNFS